jgi:hypothetical protein
MNEQLPPIDQDLRDQLARRSGGLLPDDLLVATYARLDAARPQPRRWTAPRINRLVAAGAACALIVVLTAALVVVPQFRTGPAASGLGGYPADRALTTTELASVMAGPALATNTALVASVTIDAKTDVCPMDRYPTIGVVEGMGSQVCVMGGGVSTYLTAPKAAAVFAFRYLGPGVLGLLGEITPASSSKTAFRVAEDWPLQGKTFLVDGWLGADALMDSCAFVPTPGDVLSPNGEDCPFNNWMSDEETASPSDSPGPQPKRLVQAGGMRLIDSIDHGAPLHGVFVVRTVVEPCPSDPPISSRGCGSWLVLAKLGNVSIPVASQSPSPTVSPPTGYLIDRALTTDQLGRLLAAGSLKRYDTVIVDASVTLEASGACQTPQIPDLEFSGFIVGVDPQACVYAVPNTTIQSGLLLLRVSGSNTLGYMLTLPEPSTDFTYSPTGAWPKGYFLVHGWLDTDANDCGRPGAVPTMMGYGLFPDGGVMCHAALTATRFDPTMAGPGGPTQAGPPRIISFQIPSDGRAVDDGPIFSMPGTAATSGSVEGTYVVYSDHHCSQFGSDCEEYSVLTRLADVVVPGANAPTQSTPPNSPATPIAQPSPSSDGASPGLIAPGNRPFALAEIPALLAKDPTHLAGRILVIQGPVPIGFQCSAVGLADAPATSGSCYAIRLDNRIAPDGYWAVQVDSPGNLTILGEIATGKSGLVLSLDEARAVWNTPGSEEALVLVDAWIGGMGADACDVVGQPCYEVSWLGSTPDGGQWQGATPVSGQLDVQPGAYHSFGAGPVGGGPSIHGVFLVRGPASAAQVLARIDAGTP